MRRGKLKNARQKQPTLSFAWYFALIVVGEIVATVVVAWCGSYLFEEVLEWSFTLSPMVWLVLFSLVIGSALSIMVNRKLLEPVKKLSKSMTEVADGDFEVRLETKSWSRDIRDIYENFNLMTRELRATEILQTDFVSNVSHEIKTPINAIEGYTMLLQDAGCSDEEREQYVEKILFNTKRLSELVSNILLLSKIDNQAIDANVTSFRIDEQIRQSIMLLEPKWVEKDIEFDVEMDAVTYEGNDKLLMHVWNNLIGNAVKFSPQEGLVKIRLVQRGENLIFTVDDNGPGIGVEEVKHIFDKFYQGDNSHRQEGNGLGLALVRKILDQCGGDIAVENLTPNGCRVTVAIPC